MSRECLQKWGASGHQRRRAEPMAVAATEAPNPMIYFPWVCG